MRKILNLTSGKRIFIFIIISKTFLISPCRTDKIEGIDYYDFSDVVLHYPPDSTQTDSVELDFDHDGIIDLKAFASFNNYFGIDSFHTNKTASLWALSLYQLINTDGLGCYCADWARSGQLISPQDIPSTGHFYYTWGVSGSLVNDMYGLPCPNISCTDGEIYVKMRKNISGSHAAGWLRLYIAGIDSIIFYDCAFGQRSNQIIKAGHH